MNMGNYASSCAMRFVITFLLIGSSLWMPALSRANDNNSCLETGTWSPCNEQCVPGSITQAYWLPSGNLFYACVGENFVPPKITVTTSDGKIVCNNGVNTLVCSDNPHFGQNPNNPDQVVPYIGTGYFEPPIPTSFPIPGLYYFVGKAKASPAFGSCPDIYPQTIGTLTVKALKFMFRPPYVDVCWSEGGSYEASADLTFDSYDTSAMSWSLETLDGDSSAWIDPDSGKVYFGTGGGKYILTVRSAEAPSCDASMLLYVIKYDITTSPDSPWAGDIVTYSLVPGSYVPYHIGLQWAAPNSYIECESNTTRPSTPLGGQFRIPNHMAGDYPVAVSASCGTIQKSVTSQCKDCTGLVIGYKEALAAHQLVRDEAEAHINDIWLLSCLQMQYRNLGIRLGACLTIHAYANIPADQWGNPTAAVQEFLSELSEQLFIPDTQEIALQLAGEMDQLAAQIKPLQDAYSPLYCEYRGTYGPHKQTQIEATGCIKSVEARKLCESVLNELPANSTLQGKAGYPCGVVDPKLLLHTDNWMVFDTLTFFGVAAYQLNDCN